MNNKGFAITGIIYTLFILFLMILISVLSGLNSSQRLIINSIEQLTSSLEETTLIEGSEITSINESGTAPYFGKYYFTVIGSDTIECSTYLEKGIHFKTERIILSPQDCNDYISSGLTLKKIERFEGWN